MRILAQGLGRGRLARACLVAGLLAGGVVRLAAQGTTGVTLTGPESFSGMHAQLNLKVAKISNFSGGNTGPLRLELWATAAPFPSPGYVVGQYPLSALKAGASVSNISANVTYKPPRGVYYDTFAVEEQTAFGWVVDTYAQFSTQTNFNMAGSGKAWTPPAGALAAPPASLKANNVVTLTELEFGNWTFTGTIPALTLTAQDSATLKAKGGGFAAKTTVSGLYTYKTGTALLAGKTVAAGVLKINYAALNVTAPKANSTITLYFQKGGKGWYASTGTADGLGMNTRGTFTFK